MGSFTTSAALLCLLAGAVAAIQTVFLDKQQASSIIARPKRNVGGGNPPTLEQVCMEKVCNYEEARKIFQDSYRTDIFWSVYVDGDQCAEQPCKNGALCSDSVGGYDCVCKSGFSGVHCEKDETLCTLEKNKGCSQFCKPSYTSYKCSCASGWKLSTKDSNKCEPVGPYSCGKVNSLSELDNKLKNNINSNYEGVMCFSTDCPWQALLMSSESAGFCSGVILKSNLVLTSARCANKYSSFQVAVGKRNTHEDGAQTLYVKVVHVHPRFNENRPENDVAVIELRDNIIFKREVIPVCLPERDFAESILMGGQFPALVTGWKEPLTGQTTFPGPLILNQLTYKQLPQCIETHPNLITNKMGCTVPQPNADCKMSSGSPLITLYREVFFLTGLVSQPPGANCNNGYIFQKVSRHLGWLQTLMGTR